VTGQFVGGLIVFAGLMYLIISAWHLETLNQRDHERAHEAARPRK
jgi:hypothetical protein